MIRAQDTKVLGSLVVRNTDKVFGKRVKEDEIEDSSD